MCAGQRLSRATLLLFPSAPSILLHGAGGMRARHFLLVDLAATVARAALLPRRWRRCSTARARSTPLAALLDGARALAAAHTPWALAATVALAAPGLVGACALGWRWAGGAGGTGMRARHGRARSGCDGVVAAHFFGSRAHSNKLRLGCSLHEEEGTLEAKPAGNLYFATGSAS